jgi:hypothetical protein
MQRIRASLEHLESGLDDPPIWDRELARIGILSLDQPTNSKTGFAR